MKIINGNSYPILLTQQKRSSASSSTISETSVDNSKNSGAQKITSKILDPNLKNQSIKSTMAHSMIETSQKILASEIRNSLKKSGKLLSGNVEFSLGLEGKLQISGNAHDKAAIKLIMSTDRSYPSLASRVVSLTKQTASISRAESQSSAISLAAKLSAGSPNRVSSFYKELMQHQPSSSVMFSVSETGSSLTFRGALSSSV